MKKRTLQNAMFSFLFLFFLIRLFFGDSDEEADEADVGDERANL